LPQIEDDGKEKGSATSLAIPAAAWCRIYDS
jgi:hypothetical protein